MKKVSIIGTNGIPANYGGFETLTFHLVKNLNKKFKLFVYNSKNNPVPKKKYGCKVYRIPISANGFSSFFYDLFSFLHCLKYSDVVIYLGPSNGYFLFLLKIFKIKIIVNHGGLDEWNRTKNTFFERKIIYYNHYLASKFSDVNIADNSLIKDSLIKNFGEKSKIIRYGGDHVKILKKNDNDLKKFPFLKIDYDLSISRAQIDNNLHLVLNAYEIMTDRNLVLISNWNHSKYGRDLYEKYKNHKNIFLLKAIYNQRDLNIIRSNSSLYIHSHSFCGTAPSLLEALFYKIPVICFDVKTNRETTFNKLSYFNSSETLIEILKNKLNLNFNNELFNLARKEYTWKKISNSYLDIIKKL